MIVHKGCLSLASRIIEFRCQQKSDSPMDRVLQGVMFAARGTQQASPLGKHRAAYKTKQRGLEKR